MKRALAVALLLMMAVAAAGCGGGKNPVPAAGGKVEKVEPPPPLKGEGYPWGKPPEAVVTVGGEKIGSTLASWCWPVDPNRMACDDVGWPPKLPATAVVRKTDSVKLAVYGIVVEPLEPIKLVVNPLGVYKKKERPTEYFAPADEQSLEEKDIKFAQDVMSVEYQLKDLAPGEYLLVFDVGWGVPIGGDATYLVPVEVKEKTTGT